MIFRRRFFVRDVDDRVYPLMEYLNRMGMEGRHNTIRKRILREYCKCYLREIVIPYDSVYLMDADLGTLSKENSLIPHYRQHLLYVLLDPESNKPALHFGRWPINSDELCRVNIEKMSYSCDDGNTWHPVPKIVRADEMRQGRRPLIELPRRIDEIASYSAGD